MVHRFLRTTSGRKCNSHRAVMNIIKLCFLKNIIKIFRYLQQRQMFNKNGRI
jgi:hypothetical protein